MGEKALVSRVGLCLPPPYRCRQLGITLGRKNLRCVRVIAVAVVAVLAMAGPLWAQSDNPSLGSHGVGSSFTYIGENGVTTTDEIIDRIQHQGREMLLVETDGGELVSESDSCYGMDAQLWDAETGSWAACLMDGEVLAEYVPHSGQFAFPMAVGSIWSHAASWIDSRYPDYSGPSTLVRQVEGFEEVSVPAGTFMAFRIALIAASFDFESWMVWYAPAEKLIVKTNINGFVSELFSYELATDIETRLNVGNFSSSTAISGASGRSKASSIGAGKESGEPNHAGNSGGASVWWTWTAPTTESVTFDTRGSNFDTLLAIYTGDSLDSLTEVASNDDASEGSLQSAVHVRMQQGQTYHIAVDGYGGKSGTVVLNWRSSSGVGSSGSDDFSLRASLSSASGRSVVSNVGAGIESGEPNHAGNSGGASVWWTWTASTAGPVTFDTRGSDFDTLLAVYTGDSLGNLVEVASNDDASTKDFQSVVRFNAQQGQTYHIAVDGYGGATGAIVLSWWAASPVSPLRVAVFETPDPGKPSYVIAGQNASLQYWKTSDGAVSQALYMSADATESVRVFYDGVTGAARKVLDEVSGNWMLIQENRFYGVDFWLYDRIGNYQSGFAVYEVEGQYRFGEIVGLPVHAGEQITGQLQPASASWTGSFTLEVGADDLTDIQAVPPKIAATADGLVPTAVGTGARPDDSPAAELEEDEGTATSIERLSGVGMALLALREVSGGGPWAISGAVGLVSRRFLHPALRNRQQPCGEVTVRGPEDVCLAAAGHLAGADEWGPIGYVIDVLEAGGQPPTVLVERGHQSLAHAEGRHSPLDQPLQSAVFEPIAVDQPPIIASPVSGHVMSPDATVWVSGTISPKNIANIPRPEASEGWTEASEGGPWRRW